MDRPSGHQHLPFGFVDRRDDVVTVGAEEWPGEVAEAFTLALDRIGDHAQFGGCPDEIWVVRHGDHGTPTKVGR